MTSCFQHIQLPKPIAPKDFALLRLDYDEDKDNRVVSRNITDGDFIGSEDNIKLVFKGADADTSTLYFEQIKK